MSKTKHTYPPNYAMDDIFRQAKWELKLEAFEAAVAKEKERLRNKRPWFPWRITITKL